MDIRDQNGKFGIRMENIGLEWTIWGQNGPNFGGQGNQYKLI